MCLIKETYPVEILPKKIYKKRLSIKCLLGKYRDLMVVRQVKGNANDYKRQTEAGELEWDDSIFENSLANLSMNLVGGIFKITNSSHLHFLPISQEAKKTWSGERVSHKIVADKSSFSFEPCCFGMCFYVKEIHDRTFPFFKHFDTKEERDNYANLAKDATTEREKEYDAHLVGAFENKRINVEIRPRLKVNHSPTMANYWHVTLDTYRPIDKTPVPSYDKICSSDKRMFKALKQDLKQHIMCDSKPNYKLSYSDYMRWGYIICYLLKKSVLIVQNLMKQM